MLMIVVRATVRASASARLARVGGDNLVFDLDKLIVAVDRYKDRDGVPNAH